MYAQKGNALFLILIAVALFAALSYAITQSGRGNTSINAEEFQLAYTEIQDLVSRHQFGFQRIVISNGVNMNDVDARWSGSDHVNANCGARTDCQMFHPDGGGLELRMMRRNSASFGPPTAAYYSGFDTRDSARVRYVYNWFGTPTSAADPILAFYTNRDFCVFFNRKVGVTADPDVAPTALGWNYQLAANWADNSASDGGSFANPSGHVSALAGKDEGCFKTTGGAYVIVAKLWPR